MVGLPINSMMDGLVATGQKRMNPAGEIYEDVVERMRAFERQLDQDHEIGARIAGATAFSVRRIRFKNPDLLIFQGIDADGMPVEAIQHHTQLNVVFTCLRKTEKEPFRVGFVQAPDS